MPEGAGQLPAAIQGFVGRTEYLDSLTHLLDDRSGQADADTPVAAAIVGPPGVGKTALAVHWAGRMRDRFPDGQLYLNLRGHDPGPPLSPDQAVDGILRALDVPAERIPAGAAARAELYRSLLDGRRVLVLLDDADSAEQVRPLLPTSAGCAAIVTSRDRLLPDLTGQDGVRPLPLAVLTSAEAVALLAESIGAHRVAAEPEAAADLGRGCAQLPLALRIAAHHAATRPDEALAGLVGELAAELAKEQVVAEGAAGKGAGDSVPEADDDQTAAVRAACSWSYRALPAATARAFRLLGLHAGPDISAPATAALTGTTLSQARAELAALAGAQLLMEDGPDRYRFHDLLRRYAAAHATETPQRERAAAARRVLTWYLHTADTAVRVFSPLRLRVPLDTLDGDLAGLAGIQPTFADRGQALAWCEAERANLVAATRHAADSGLHAVAWKLPAVLWDFFSLHGHWTDWITTHEIGLAAARRLRDRHGEAWMENNLGTAYRGLGRFTEALPHFQRALVINTKIGNRRGEGWTRYNLGDTYRELGQYEEALGYLRQALLIGREMGERWGEGYTLNMIGETYRCLGRLDEALRHLLPALVINRDIGHRRGEGFTLQSLGDTYRERRRFDQALDCYQQALAIRREIGDRRGESTTLHSLGSYHQQGRRFGLALDCYQQALAIRHESGDRPGEARTLANLGTILRTIGRTAEAVDSWRRALVIFEDLDDPEAAQVRTSLVTLDPAGGGPRSRA